MQLFIQNTKSSKDTGIVVYQQAKCCHILTNSKCNIVNNRNLLSRFGSMKCSVVERRDALCILMAQPLCNTFGRSNNTFLTTSKTKGKR